MTTISLDIETTGLNWQKDKILLNGYRINATGEVIYATPESVYGPLNSLLRDPNNILRGAGIKFDALFLAKQGYEINCKLEDTRIIAYLMWPNEPALDLKSLVRSKLHGNPTDLSDLLFRPLKAEAKHLEFYKEYYFNIDDYLCRRDRLMAYHREDVLNIDRLRVIMAPTRWFYDVEMPLTRILFESELYGCPLDIPYLKTLKDDYEYRLKEITVELFRVAGKEFNPNSPKQVIEILKDQGYNLSEVLEKTKTGGYSADGLSLKKLAWKGDMFAKVLLDHRRISKLLSTYVRPFITESDSKGHIHGSFNQAGSEDLYGDGGRGTNTGRLTSTNPNLQNIPTRTKEGKNVRKAFIPTSEEFGFDSDLSQIEPRYLAHKTQSKKLLNAYANNIDTHSLFASDIFGKEINQVSSSERFIGKTSWLATVYRCYYKKLLLIAERNSDEPIMFPDFDRYLLSFDDLPSEPIRRFLWIDSKSGLIKLYGSEDNARNIYAKWMFFKGVQDRFKKSNPELMDWSEEQIDRVRRCGYITTYGGRRIYLPEINSLDKQERSKAERKAINSDIQGSCADIMKIITIETHKKLVIPHGARIHAIVHDETYGSIQRPEHLSIVKDIMENTCHLNNVLIKSDTKLVNNWSEK